MPTPMGGGVGARLPLELIELVVEQLALSPGHDPHHTKNGRHALATLMRVSRTFHDLIGPVLYSRIVLTRNNADALFYGFKRTEGIRKTKHVFPSKEAYWEEFDKFHDLFWDSDNEDDGPGGSVGGEEEAGHISHRDPSRQPNDPDLEKCARNLAWVWKHGKPMPEDCGEYDDPLDEEEEAEELEHGESSRKYADHTLPLDYESLSETDDDEPLDRKATDQSTESSVRKQKLLGYCRVLHILQLPNRNLMRDLAGATWTMDIEHLIVSSRVMLRVLQSEFHRLKHRFDYEADDFLPKLCDLAQHTCITWPSDQNPTVRQVFRFARKGEGLDMKTVWRLRASVKSELRFQDRNAFFEAQSLVLNLNDTAPDEPGKIDTFEFISTGNVDLREVQTRVGRYTTRPHCLFMSTFFDEISDFASHRDRSKVAVEVEKLRRSRDVLKAFLKNRSMSSPSATKEAAKADETYRYAQMTLREFEEHTGLHEMLFDDKLESLFEREDDMFPLTSERIKITHVDDADPCAACGRKDFEEESNLRDLVASTQRLPLMIDRKRG